MTGKRNPAVMAGALPVTVAGAEAQPAIFFLERFEVAHLGPGAEEETPQAWHLVTVVKLDGVVGRGAGKVALPFLFGVVAVGATVTQQILASVPEIQMQEVALGWPEAETGVAQQRHGIALAHHSQA